MIERDRSLRDSGLRGPINLADHSASLSRGSRPRHTNEHPHSQYTLFDDCIAPGPSGFTPRLSHRLASASLAPCQNPPPPDAPAPLPPPPLRVSPNQPARTSGAGVAAPSVPPEWRGHTVYGRHGACVTCRAAHRRDQRRGYAQARLRARVGQAAHDPHLRALLRVGSVVSGKGG